MQLPTDLSLLTPARLWSALDADTRALAAQSLYARGLDGGAGRRAADRAIAAALRFREVAVARLPLARRVSYLAKVVQPDENLSYSLLMALHLGERKQLLATFLDALGIPQADGLIDEKHELVKPAADTLATAVATAYERFPPDQVTLYLGSLLAMDPDVWGDLASLIRRPAVEA
jgi:hypothetical protein